MIVLGLTGSMGMGKTQTAEFFREEGVPVQSADDVVHRLYRAGGAGAAVVQKLYPEAIAPDGSVVRATLRNLMRSDPESFRRIEREVHALVRAARDAFLADAREDGAALAVLDVPLLFETGLDAEVDVVVVVSAPEDQQRARILQRPGMTEQALEAVLNRQMPDQDKRARADFIVDTGSGIESARRAVRAIHSELRNRPEN